MGREAEVQLAVVGVRLPGMHGSVGMMDGQDPEAGVVHRAAYRSGWSGQPTGLTERHAMADERVRGGPQPFAFANRSDGVRISQAPSEAFEGVDRRWTADPVDAQAGVALELLTGSDGVGSEDAVDAPGVEAEPSEATLQLSDVLAPHHGGLQVEQPVGQLVPVLDQLSPRVRTADAVGIQSVVGLERDDGALGSMGESAVVGSGIEAGGPQP